MTARLLDLLEVLLYWRLATALAGHPRCTWRHSERSRLNFLLHRRDSPEKITPEGSMADARAGAAARLYASLAEVRADVERAGGDASHTDGTCNNGHWCAVGMHARVWCRWPGVALQGQ